MKITVEEAIAQYDRAADFIGGCGDGGCVVKRPVGQHTNGGCRCSDERHKARRMMMAASQLRAALNDRIEVPEVMP